ncbi:hypothetical protein V8F20_001792 [Naviculisporaceae sp. PSN 640]
MNGVSVCIWGWRLFFLFMGLLLFFSSFYSHAHVRFFHQVTTQAPNPTKPHRQPSAVRAGQKKPLTSTASHSELGNWLTGGHLARQQLVQ